MIQSKKAMQCLAILIQLSMTLQACGQQSQGGYEQNDSVQSTQGVVDQIDQIQGNSFGVQSSDEVYDGYKDTSDTGNNDYSNQESEQDNTQSSGDKSQNQQTGENNIKLVEEKLVYTCNLEIETKNYSEDKANLEKLIKEFGGVVQSSYEYDNDYSWYMEDHEKTHGTKSLESEVRIPQSKFQDFVSTVGAVGKVIKNQQSVDNISQTYYDTEQSIEQLKIQEQRLLQMMEQATTIDEMITVESRLTQVQSQLSKLQTQLVYMDMDVAYSYVNIELEEVFEYTSEPQQQKGFFVRLVDEAVDGFKDMIIGLQDLVIFIVGFVPRAIPTVLFIWICYLIIKLIIKKRKEYLQKHPEKQRKNRNHGQVYGDAHGQPGYQGYNQYGNYEGQAAYGMNGQQGYAQAQQYEPSHWGENQGQNQGSIQDTQIQPEQGEVANKDDNDVQS